MITVRIKIYHRLSGHQLSYHQTFDGGEYKNRYTEYMKIMIDNVNAIDYNTLSILSEYERKHNGEWTDDDVSWFEVCNNDDYDRYDDEQQSKELLNHINQNEYKFIFYTNNDKDSNIVEDSSFFSPSQFYDQVFYANVRNCEVNFTNQISSLNKQIEILSKRLEAFKLSVEDRKQKIHSEIETLQLEKLRKRFDLFRDAIMGGKLSCNMIIPEYGKYPLELAMQYDDIDLFFFLCNNVGETLCLSEKYIKQSNTIFGAEEGNNAFISLYNHNNLVIQDCLYFLICHKENEKLYLFLKYLLSYKEIIRSVSESAFTDIHVAYFIMLLINCNLEDCLNYLYSLFSERESIKQRFCMELEYLLTDKSGKDRLRKDKKYCDMLPFLSIYDNFDLINSVSGDVKTLILTTLHMTPNNNEEDFVDLGLPSGTKWLNRSIGYLMPRYCLNVPSTSYNTITNLSEFTNMNTIEILFGKKYDFPEVEDFQELLKYCDWHWQKEGFLDNGGYRLGGYEVIGKNGNRLFLRAAGYIDENGKIQESKDGFYWTNTKDELKSDSPICFVFDRLGKFTNFVTGSNRDNVMIIPIMRSKTGLPFKDLLEQGKEEDLNSHITMYENDRSHIDEYGVRYTADEKKLIRCPKNIDVEKYIVKEGVKVLGLQAFGFCKSLNMIVLPNSLVNIGNGAFNMCSKLKYVHIPDKVKEIGRHAFVGCKSLESIIIPENVTSIGNAAFWNCSSLQTVILRSNQTNIGENVFRDCVSLKEIQVPKESLLKYRQLMPEVSDIIIEK